MDTAMNSKKTNIGGLTGNQLKIIGVILMVLDHLHQMFIERGAPSWFTMVGRVVAPIFIFLTAEGMYYTRSRKRYILQLFVGFEFMNIASAIISAIFPSDSIVLMNNIFGTLFLIALYIVFIDGLIEGIRSKRPSKIVGFALLTLAPIASGVLFMLAQQAVIAHASQLSTEVIRLTFTALMCIPNVLTAEGGYSFVIIGVLFYYFRRWRWAQILTLAAFAVASYFQNQGWQWLMVFAAIPIMLYNGKRGGGSKYFFYIFYPAHIYALYIIAYYLQ
ncbi:MAG: conjugal transfer protein TraX [Oscillospiraceae bacterium]|jgi:hypothetical protein|nr:conjugal transfer protein TraX [Oscillospiraceae bacterium]